MSDIKKKIKNLVSEIGTSLIEVSLTWATAWPLILLVGAYIPESWKGYLINNLVNTYYATSIIVTIVALYALRPFFVLIINYFFALAAYNARVTNEGTNNQIMPATFELWSSYTISLTLILKLFVVSQMLLLSMDEQFKESMLQNKIERLQNDIDALKIRVDKLHSAN